jgi:hypothetical protein
MIAKIQKDTDTHAAIATPRLNTGAARYTVINGTGLRSRSLPPSTDSESSIFRWCLKMRESERVMELEKSQAGLHKCNGISRRSGNNMMKV